jgi:hypothetical protein
MWKKTLLHSVPVPFNKGDYRGILALISEDYRGIYALITEDYRKTTEDYNTECLTIIHEET